MRITFGGQPGSRGLRTGRTATTAETPPISGLSRGGVRSISFLCKRRRHDLPVCRFGRGLRRRHRRGVNSWGARMSTWNRSSPPRQRSLGPERRCQSNAPAWLREAAFRGCAYYRFQRRLRFRSRGVSGNPIEGEAIGADGPRPGAFAEQSEALAALFGSSERSKMILRRDGARGDRGIEFAVDRR